jgi:hypothetical protein
MSSLAELMQENFSLQDSIALSGYVLFYGTISFDSAFG